MTTAQHDPASPQLPSHRWTVIWSRIQFVLSLGVTVAVLAYLLLSPAAHNPEPPVQAATGEVSLVGHRLIHVVPGTPLANRLQIITLKEIQTTTPQLAVTGVVAASLRPGKTKGTFFWQFNTPELLTTYTDWQKAGADIKFATTQLEAIKELADTRVSSQKKVVERLTKLVEAGTESLKDLTAEENSLLQFKIQGRKEIHEADTALRIAERSEAALSRQLQQGGLDPELLKSANKQIDVVMADVPELKANLVKVGDGCEATFFGQRDHIFTGKVNGISPVLSKERRSLRVLFIIDDPKDILHPGMFADIGLGTDPRKTLQVPTEAVIHVGRSDYVLTAADGDNWRVTEVELGEVHDDVVEILKGLHDGDRVLGQGSILLKPYVVQAVQLVTPPSPLPLSPGGEGKG